MLLSVYKSISIGINIVYGDNSSKHYNFTKRIAQRKEKKYKATCNHTLQNLNQFGTIHNYSGITWLHKNNAVNNLQEN